MSRCLHKIKLELQSLKLYTKTFLKPLNMIHINKDNSEILKGIDDITNDYLLCDLPYYTTISEIEKNIDFEFGYERYKQVKRILNKKANS